MTNKARRMRSKSKNPPGAWKIGYQHYSEIISRNEYQDLPVYVSFSSRKDSLVVLDAWIEQSL